MDWQRIDTMKKVANLIAICGSDSKMVIDHIMSHANKLSKESMFSWESIVGELAYLEYRFISMFGIIKERYE